MKADRFMQTHDMRRFARLFLTQHCNLRRKGVGVFKVPIKIWSSGGEVLDSRSLRYDHEVMDIKSLGL